MLEDLHSHTLADVCDTHTMQMGSAHHSSIIQRPALVVQLSSIHLYTIDDSFEKLDEEIVTKAPTSSSAPNSDLASWLKLV